MKLSRHIRRWRRHWNRSALIGRAIHRVESPSMRLPENEFWRKLETSNRRINALHTIGMRGVNPRPYVWLIAVFSFIALIALTGQSSCSTTDADLDDWTIDQGDCNDADPSTYPGASETCDGADNDCNGSIDETDADGDSSSVCTDCDDLDPANHPGNVEACDGQDNDCDGHKECKKCSDGTACGDTCISDHDNCTEPPGCACQMGE